MSNNGMDDRKNSIYEMLETPISLLPGIGPKRLKCLSEMGITVFRDLLYCFPRGYQHRGDVKRLDETEDGEVCSLLLTVATKPQTSTVKKRMTVTKLLAFDESGKCTVTFFNNQYIDKVLTEGATYRFWGKISFLGKSYVLSSPQFEVYYENVPLPEFAPVYPLRAGLTQKIMSKAIGYVLDRIKPCDIPDILPWDVRQRYGLVRAGEAFLGIHRPMDYAQINRVRNRFIFEELYLFALCVTVMKSKEKRYSEIRMSRGSEGLRRFTESLPYDLTGAQKRAVSEIEKDMTRSDGKPMTRLLSGDVGSGKTVCAAAAVYIAVMNGYQAALMAPTEILARQHFRDLEPFFEKLSVKTAVLTGQTKPAEKKRIKAALAAGEIDFIIGTHALLTVDTEFFNLGLAITDEQHRFGILQRTALTGKSGGGVHSLVMSATPIPRTLALIMYGDLDLSVLDELPPGRKPVGTFVVDESYRDRLNGFIRKQVENGNQVYIVCPAIEAEACDADEGNVITLDEFDNVSFNIKPEREKLKSAVEYAKLLSDEVFPDLTVACIHGKMKGEEKNKIMEAFKRNEISILVSTTVIEVGINIPNATLMIVENAERFGLSQLHQLRGRIGRGADKSYCILVSENKNDAAGERLKIMNNTSNGYKIAEYDLEMRGPGDFFPKASGGARQHGELRFRLANLCCDTGVLRDAFAEAAKTAANDAELKKPENAAARYAMSRMFEVDGNYLN